MPESSAPESAGQRTATLSDRELLEPIARAALGEITPESSIGAFREILLDDAVATVHFSNRMGGYPGWVWVVAIAVNEGLEPSVLETELMPSDGALVAPDWVPWSDRLEEYLAHQADVEGESDGGDEADEDDDQDDDQDDDEDDLDPDDDVDGVDIDAHAGSDQDASDYDDSGDDDDLLTDDDLGTDDDLDTDDRD